MKKTLYDYCLESGRADLLVEWDTAENLPRTPQTISYGSSLPMGWICRQGHRWKALVKSRTNGTGCPVCTNRRLQPGVNDLATQFPHLVDQWDREKNGALTPDQLLAGTRRKVWWRCDLGHSWQSSVMSRTAMDTGCPVCAGKQVVPGENDLASFRPDLARQWHPTKNLPLTPETITANSNRKVWWQCDLGHDWRSPVGRRVQGNTGCPVCMGKQVLPGFNDLASVDPAIAAQWDQELNGSLTPEMVTGGSAQRVWWRCDEGHVWKTVIYARTGAQRTGCPVCAGRHKKKRYRNVLEIFPETECK